jgi:hypothetical protein
MVIGDRFAWGHLPKTGGEATRSMFQLFPDLIQFADSRGSHEQHNSFGDREAAVQGKVLALNIRRLPSWVLSREHHKARWGLHPELVPIPMDSPHQMAESSFPDSRLALLLENGKFQIDRWLRMEFLADDFIAFISDFVEVGDEATRERIFTRGRINALEYDHDIRHWFTEEQIRRMYRHNPLWATAEERVYGGTILDSGGP